MVFTETQLRYLRESARSLRAESGWADEVKQRREASAHFREIVEGEGVLRGELSSRTLAALLEAVRSVRHLVPARMAQLLGTYAYYCHAHGFEGTEAEFAESMAVSRPDWPEGSTGKPGVDLEAFGRDLAALLRAGESELGAAFVRVIGYEGAGTGLANAVLFLWDPRRHPLVTKTTLAPFKAKAGPLRLDKRTRSELAEVARKRFEVPDVSSARLGRTASWLRWRLLFAEILEACELDDFAEVDVLLSRLSGGAGSRVEEGEAALDFDGRIKAGISALSADRIATREKAMDEARQLIDEKLGNLQEADFRRLLGLFNTDYSGGRTRSNRFSPAFGGQLVQELAENLDEANGWVEQLWNAKEEDEIVRALDDFWADAEIRGAGRSFPTVILHAREPERFPPLMGGLVRGYRELTGESIRQRSGQVYLHYAKELRRLCETYGISPHGIDLVLTEAARVQPRPPTTTRVQPEGDVGGPGVQELHKRTEFLEETLLDEAWLDRTEALLREKPQIVLHGPPGTGKTWVAERLGGYLTGGRGEVKVVQFHPSYSYEDFIEGIRPTLGETSERITYRVEPGVFRSFCERAADRPDETFVLIIDEINRGNLPKIFGELLFLLERRGEEGEVELPISRARFSVPKNVFLIGTMNTADQAIALVDVALRRRFHFMPMHPNSEVLRGWLDQHAPEMSSLAGVLDELNAALRNDGIDANLAMGHTHFMVPDLDHEGLRRLWAHSVFPTLEEYFYGKAGKIQRFTYERFVEPRLSESVEEPDDLEEADDDA